jgi:hypothetical protein
MMMTMTMAMTITDRELGRLVRRLMSSVLSTPLIYLFARLLSLLKGMGHSQERQE